MLQYLQQVGDFMKITEDKGNIYVEDLKCFNLGLSVDCGQSFRWVEKDKNVWHAVVGKSAVNIEQTDNNLIFYNTDMETFKNVWVKYFDFDRDYEKITNDFDDPYLITAVKEYYGIRVLNQDPWEALCSFIISQNNNIPRIKGIIERLCENFGDDLGNGDYSFPDAERIAKCTVEDLSVLRSGFRAKYIIDAAQKVASGEVDLYNIRNLPIEDGRTELMKIVGVGPKVAECVLLYSCEKTEAFPVDVWVKRIVSELYPDGLPECFGEYKGIAQQYLFHWRRNQ